MNRIEYLKAKLKLIDAFYKLEIGWTSSQITAEKQRSQVKEMAATQRYTKEREDKEMILDIIQESDIGEKMCTCDWKKLIDDLFDNNSSVWKEKNDPAESIPESKKEFTVMAKKDGLWLSTPKINGKQFCINLLSVGNKEMLTEIWSDLWKEKSLAPESTKYERKARL